MKKNQGITLVALVITIIVLLILAGVTISLVIGDNGLLNKAENAGEEYIKASLKEEIELAITDISAELAMKNPPQSLTKQEIIDRLQDHVQEIITIDSALTGEYKGYEYWIDDNYVVHIGKENEFVNKNPKIKNVVEKNESSESILEIIAESETPIKKGIYRLVGESQWREFNGTSFVIYELGSYEIKLENEAGFSRGYVHTVQLEFVSIVPKLADNSRLETNIPVLSGGDPFYMFNKTYNGALHSVSGVNSSWLASKKGYFTVRLDKPLKANNYKITSQGGYPGRDPNTWKIYGSQDNMNWELLDIRTGEKINGIKEYSFSNEKEYMYYKMEITANGGDSYLVIREFDYQYKRK